MVSDQNKEEIKKRWCQLKTRNRWVDEEKEEDGSAKRRKKRKKKKRKERKKNAMSGPAFLNYKRRDNKIYEITNLPLY